MFLSSIRAEDRSPFGQFWFEPVGMRTSSGARVSPDSAMCLSAVFRSVALVSGHMALLPVVFLKRGTRKKIKHPLLKLLNRRPNRWQNAFEWREMIQGHLELRGNAYNEIIADGRGEIQELVPRHPDRVRVEMLSDGDYRYKIKNPDGSERAVARGSIWHIRGLSSDGVVGLSVIEYARESFGLGLAAQSYGARFFANDAKPSGGWIEYPGKFADKTSRMMFRESVQEAQAAANRGKLMVLDRGMQYHEVGLTNEDAQFLETRKFSVDDIARWFGLPPHKIGNLDRSTNSNIEHQGLEYVTDALLTRASRWKASIDAELLFDDEEIDVEFDFSELERGDSAARSTYYQKGILGGWMTRNEARGLEGLDPLDGLDEPLRPLNMVEENEAEDEEGEDGAEKPDVPANSAPEDSAARLKAMVVSNASRVARRIAKAAGKSPDASVIAEAMAVPMSSAASWVDEWRDRSADESALTASLIALGLKA